MMNKKPRILILGAGYGGMMTAVRFQKTNIDQYAEIILVNKHDYHYQTTWLHEPAAGTLHHDRTRLPINSIIDKNKIKFLIDTVVRIIPEEKKVILKNSELDYDYLVVGLGSEPETFGIPGVKEHAFAIRSVNSVRLIREHIEYMFANYNNKKEKKEEDLSFVVAGAGFTGIEFLGELSERIPELCREYDVKRENVKIYSVEASTNVLPGFNEDLVKYAINLLEGRGIVFKMNSPIQEVKKDSIILKGGEIIKARTIVWTTGVRGSTVLERSGFDTVRGRIKVNKDLSLPGYDGVYVIGDSALFIDEKTGRPYPPTAQIAMQQSFTLADNIYAFITGKGKVRNFKPEIRGTIASLGGSEAIGLIGSRKIFGFPAATLKKVVDNRSLFLLGGIPLVLKKGKFNFF